MSKTTTKQQEFCNNGRAVSRTTDTNNCDINQNYHMTSGQKGMSRQIKIVTMAATVTVAMERTTVDVTAKARANQL